LATPVWANRIPNWGALPEFHGKVLTEVSVDIDFFRGVIFTKEGGVPWNIERTQAVIFGTSVRGALSTPKSLISWFCITADRLMVASATNAKHWSNKSAALIKRTSTVSRDALRLKKTKRS
jgi:hypothetical protein